MDQSSTGDRTHEHYHHKQQDATNIQNYGVDAPAVMRNLFLLRALCLILAFVLPQSLHLGSVVLLPRPFFLSTAGSLLGGGLLFLLYVKVGKFRHRDMMLGLVTWRGDERVLDVGCGRGLLLAGAAKRLTSGRATGLDVWSNVDIGWNSPEATVRNLELEGVSDRFVLVSAPAQEMLFADQSFDVIMSNLCLHHIDNRPTRLRALDQIRRVLAPDRMAVISDYKRTREYASAFCAAGLLVERRSGSFFTTFPPLYVIITRKPR